jgi:opacity protein-like surface antigen
MPFTCLRDCEPKWVGWANLSFYEKTGKSTCLHDGTHIKNGAFNMGAKYYFCHTDGYRPYLGLGIGFAYVNFRDHSSGVRTHIHKWGPALLVKAGLEIDLAHNFFADLFADYSSNWFGNTHSRHCVKTHHVNTGGGNFGLGLGYRF